MTITPKKQVYSFDEGRAEMKSLLGGKGANLSEMIRIGLVVPPGFVVTTEACTRYYQEGQILSSSLKEEVGEYLKALENKMDKKFGDAEKPLLLSVRSGAVVSMPGMMDTILNLGLNRETTEGLARQVNDRRFALDCYRRFIQMYGDVVLKVEYDFDEIMQEEKDRRGFQTDMELDEEALEVIIDRFIAVIEKETGQPFPTDPREQLFHAIQAVFDSWNTPRANVYRKANNIPDDLGTAVNVQTMVFGNRGESSGTGVIFTRNPSTGENKLYGEYLINAQGEDVVAGIRTPEMIDNLKEEMPEIYDELIGFCKKLERHYKDMQDIEFTIEEGKLYFLQTRTGKRTAASAVKVAVDLVKEGIITREEAILRIQPDQLEQLLHRQIDERAKLDVIAGGLPASPGAASGQVVFDADTAQEWGEEGRKVILVRTETTPDDIHGMIAAEGILTSRGGMTSHAAVVARGMGKPCVCGCESIRVDNANQCFQVDGRTVAKGEVISIDGATGRVIWGEVPMVEHRISGDFQTILDWADKARTMKVRANADTPEDAARAIELGAEGIGLCRTEHMFFSPERLPIVQEMILAESLEKREAALQRILPFQRDDFKGILKAMAGYPVTIRLLDPPLHEFLPDRDELLVQVNNLRRGGESAELKEKEALWQKVNAMHEFNPMLGHRGCRLGLVFPEIYRMQVRAILEAAAELIREGFKKTDILPEIMIPLVGNENEIRIMREVITKVMAEVEKETSIEFSYPIGTMIELPRACMAANQIAGHADFFSFGTNDLTQTTFGFSRDDAEGKFLPHYLDNNILARNPFMEIDREGVGGLVQIAVEKGRALKPDLKLGICGEHGGNPASVNFFQDAGLDYVSCSPFRVPVARLAAAQAALSNKDQ